MAVDSDRTNKFCEIITMRRNHDPLFIKLICFTNKATFCLNGVNKQAKLHTQKQWAATDLMTMVAAAYMGSETTNLQTV